MDQSRKYKDGELFVLETKSESQGRGTEKIKSNVCLQHWSHANVS